MKRSELLSAAWRKYLPWQPAAVCSILGDNPLCRRNNPNAVGQSRANWAEFSDGCQNNAPNNNSSKVISEKILKTQAEKCFSY